MTVQDEVLAAVMAEVQGVLDKWDVMGVVAIVDGKGHAEWRLAIDRPTWSTIRFLKDGRGIHFKGYMKTRPVDTQKTTNGICCATDVVARMAGILIALEKQVTEKMQTEKEQGKWEDR